MQISLHSAAVRSVRKWCTSSIRRPLASMAIHTLVRVLKQSILREPSLTTTGVTGVQNILSMATAAPAMMPLSGRCNRRPLCSSPVPARSQQPPTQDAPSRIRSNFGSKHILMRPCAQAEVASRRVALEDAPVLAKWCSMSDPRKVPPTAVLVHGILGNRRNLKSFARMLLEEHPAWQVLLVDLRAHGDSAALTHAPFNDPPSVDTAASDVLNLLRSLKIFPKLLVGHSFGGKVVLSMAEQFGSRLPRPVSVWVLDTVPGALQGAPSQSVASPHPLPRYDDSECSATGSQADHPRRLIQQLQQLQLPISSRSELINELIDSGFSDPVARWVATNLRPVQSARDVSQGSSTSSTAAFAASSTPRAVGATSRSVHNGVSSGSMTSRGASGSASLSYSNDSKTRKLVWSFDLDGIAAMYNSYEQRAHWNLLESPPQGLSVDFVRAEHSNFRWGGGDAEKIRALGHAVHFLKGAGHWVHTDNPQGLLKIMQPAFGSKDESQVKQAAAYAEAMPVTAR